MLAWFVGWPEPPDIRASARCGDGLKFFFPSGRFWRLSTHAVDVPRLQHGAPALPSIAAVDREIAVARGREDGAHCRGGAGVMSTSLCLPRQDALIAYARDGFQHGCGGVGRGLVRSRRALVRIAGWFRPWGFPRRRRSGAIGKDRLDPSLHPARGPGNRGPKRRRAFLDGGDADFRC
jgi:hypothetical protein